MTILGIRSVNLTIETTNAWKTRIAMAKRGRTIPEIMGLGFSTILNMGKSTFAPDMSQYPNHKVWNHGDDIGVLLWPGATRELLGDMMPPRPTEFPADVWLKTPGAHGRGKFKKSIEEALVLPREWDWQSHIEGQEYRLVTVGTKVVQDHKRNGENGNRSYEWLAMRETPQVLKDMAREAADRVPGANVIAWDLILTDDGIPYLFEGNTSPGVNQATVARIVNIMEESE